jgi:hypothetical protein
LVQITRIDFVAREIDLHNFGPFGQVFTGWRWCDFPLYPAVEGSILPGETRVDSFPININPTAGSMGIYRTREFGTPSELMDYLKWGSGSPFREGVANAAGLWPQGTHIPTTADTTLIELTDMSGAEAHTLDDYRVTNSTPEPVFQRGDVNDDGLVTIADPMVIFFFLFLGSVTPGCDEVADADNNGTIDFQNGLDLLNYLFGFGSPPASPGPSSCGIDPDDPDSAGDLGCEDYTSCS